MLIVRIVSFAMFLVPTVPIVALSQDRLPRISWLELLSRVEHSPSEQFGLTPAQYEVLLELSRESRQSRLARQWSDGREEEVKRHLSEVLMPFQVDLMVRDANETFVRGKVNRAIREGKGASPVSLPELQDVLDLNNSQRTELTDLDTVLLAKLTDLAEELARREDELAEEYERRLVRVLQREQGVRCQELMGQPSKLAQEFTAQGRRSREERPRPAASIQIIEPPRNDLRLDERVIEQVAKKLVLRADLEQDLVLVAEQERAFKETREVLETELHPRSLPGVLPHLGRSPQELDMLEQIMSQAFQTREDGRQQEDDQQADQPVRPTLREQVQLVEQASLRAMETLLPYQQRRLREVALQYVVGQSGAKFPLRFPWVRQQVEVTSEQAGELDELIREHDEKLAELAAEYQEKEAEIRREAERELYDVLTGEQQQRLEQYIGPPAWAIEEGDEG